MDESIPPNIAFIVSSAIYYLFIAVTAFISISTVYILTKYSKSRNVAITVSLIFAIIFLALLSNGISILNKIS